MSRPCPVCKAEPCFTHCIYCGADCDAGAEHVAACPSATGVFPVTERDVMCSGGCGCRTGMCCSECGREFAVGDSYTHRPARDDSGEPMEMFGSADVVEPVCLGCAATAAASTWGAQ